MPFMYLLDSNILIDLARGKGAIQNCMSRVGLSNCVISEISIAELYVGAYKSGSKKEEAVMSFLENLCSIVPITSVLKTYAGIRAQLELEGKRLDNMNLFIGATALANDYILVTHNTKHFSRIPGLKLEDWVE